MEFVAFQYSSSTLENQSTFSYTSFIYNTNASNYIKIINPIVDHLQLLIIMRLCSFLSLRKIASSKQKLIQGIIRSKNNSDNINKE